MYETNNLEGVEECINLTEMLNKIENKIGEDSCLVGLVMADKE
jgi:hypothetical protein